MKNLLSLDSLNYSSGETYVRSSVGNKPHLLGMLENLKVMGLKIHLNGELVNSKTALLNIISGMKWNTRTVAKIIYNCGDNKFQKGFIVRTFKDSKTYENSIYCRGGVNYGF